MQALHRRCWELAVARVNNAGEGRELCNMPSAITERRQRAAISPLVRPLGQHLDRLEKKAEFLAANL